MLKRILTPIKYQLNTQIQKKSSPANCRRRYIRSRPCFCSTREEEDEDDDEEEEEDNDDDEEEEAAAAEEEREERETEKPR